MKKDDDDDDSSNIMLIEVITTATNIRSRSDLSAEHQLEIELHRSERLLLVLNRFFSLSFSLRSKVRRI